MTKLNWKAQSFLTLALFGLLAACTKSAPTTLTLHSPGKAIAGYVHTRLATGNPIGPDEIIESPTGASREQECKDFQAGNSSPIKDYIEVPENPDESEGRKIKVFYYGKIVTGQTPIAFFNGGPEANSWGSYYDLEGTKWNFDPTHSQPFSFIYIDQRGTGCSDPYPQGNDPETLQRLTHYGSKGIVADAEAIRKKLLGDQPWKIFGQSYGAFIVHRYMIDAPQGIFSAHAHANTISSDPVERRTNRIYSQHRVLQRYLEQYPNDRAVIENLRSVMTKDYCLDDETTKAKACGFELLTSFISLLGFQTSWSGLHRWLNQIWTEDGFNAEVMKQFASSYYFPDFENYESLQYVDSVISVTDRNVSASCNQVFDALKNRGIDPQSILLHECMGDFQVPPDDSTRTDLDPRIQALPRSIMTVAAFKEALIKNPNVPFYLYSGDLDTFVPQENFAEELHEVSDLVHYTNFLGTGHDGFSTEPLVWAHLAK